MIVRSLMPLIMLAAGVAAQRPPAPSINSVTGTYALGTRHSFSPGQDGCWLETAPVTADSLRLQVLCRDARPGHHLGLLDTRLQFHQGAITYETDRSVGHCRIVVTFASQRAVVTQEGIGASSDQACGFGAYVDISGTYGRINRRQPAFELGPIERKPSPARSPRDFDIPDAG